MTLINVPIPGTVWIILEQTIYIGVFDGQSIFGAQQTRGFHLPVLSFYKLRHISYIGKCANLKYI